jgi:large subunit ribosomal protein L21
MYAVIRAGGKQYRVAPGDIVRVEKLPEGHGESVTFSDVVAVSGEAGSFGAVKDAVVSAEVVEIGRADKILVFHFKRKKQYKKIYGHRQPFTAVRITEIAFDGQSFKAPDLPKRKKKAAPPDSEGGEKHAAHKGKPAHKKAAVRKPKAAKKHEAKKTAKAKKKK